MILNALEKNAGAAEWARKNEQERQQDLIKFLKKAKAHLSIHKGRVSRNSEPEAFIFLLDNVLELDEEPVVAKSQLVRTR